VHVVMLPSQRRTALQTVLLIMMLMSSRRMIKISKSMRLRILLVGTIVIVMIIRSREVLRE